jgi:hypothetical protein
MPNWLHPDTYQHILFQRVHRPGERSVGKYFDHSLPSEEDWKSWSEKLVSLLH